MLSVFSKPRKIVATEFGMYVCRRRVFFYALLTVVPSDASPDPVSLCMHPGVSLGEKAPRTAAGTCFLAPPWRLWVCWERRRRWLWWWCVPGARSVECWPGQKWVGTLGGNFGVEKLGGAGRLVCEEVGRTRNSAMREKLFSKGFLSISRESNLGARW